MSTKSTGRDLILKINRPQYVPNPEMFISALAWRLAEEKIPGWSKGKQKGEKNIALVYETNLLVKEQRYLKYVETRPDAEMDGLAGWIEDLSRHNLRFTDHPENGAKSIADALRGVVIEKSTRQAATPLSPSIALLQNGRGVFAKNSVTDLGLVIEQIFSLGNTSRSARDDEEIGINDSATALWFKAMCSRLEKDLLLAQIDGAVEDSIKRHHLNSDENAIVGSIFPDKDDLTTILQPFVESTDKISNLDLGSRTPFAWFFEAWTNLTNENWVNALPARRWVDWATTILRMAFGFAYVWEANWSLAIASLVTDPNTESNEDERCLYNTRMPGQLPSKVDLAFLLDSPRLAEGVAMHWKDSENTVSLRDVAPALRVTLSRGLRIRQILDDAIPKDTTKTIEETVFDLYCDPAVKELLRDAQREKFQNQAKSLWEAVKYTLLARNQTGDSADFYGLLKSVPSKFTVIEPATEWVAAISSIAINRPGGRGNLGTVRTDLSRLGLRPSVSELTDHLEAAGLAQSAADADTAVTILSAY